MREAVLSMVMVFALLPLYGQEGSQQKIAAVTFRETSHDFGLLGYKEAPRSYVFWFTNTGNAPLVITHAEVNCKCLRAEYPKKPVETGETNFIKVIYSPKKSIGRFSNKILIYTNGAHRRHTLTVTGEVIKQ